MERMNTRSVRQALATGVFAMGFAHLAHLCQPLSWWNWVLFGIVETILFAYAVLLLALARMRDDMEKAEAESYAALIGLSSAQRAFIDSQSNLLVNLQARLDLSAQMIMNLETRLNDATKMER